MFQIFYFNVFLFELLLDIALVFFEFRLLILDLLKLPGEVGYFNVFLFKLLQDFVLVLVGYRLLILALLKLFGEVGYDIIFVEEFIFGCCPGAACLIRLFMAWLTFLGAIVSLR